MSSTKTVLITGAAGFIGGRIAEVLRLSGQASVRASVKKWSGAARIGRFPIEVVLCDVMDEQQVAQAVVGANQVIHCAVGPRSVIVQGTTNMLEAALKQGVERFVFLSTSAVYGNANGRIDETFPLQRTGDPEAYADSKIDAEQQCWRYYEKGLPVTVIRPSIVYGPFSESWTVRLTERLQSGNWGIFKDYGEGFCNLVYVDDLVSGILLAARHENAVGEAFNMNGPEQITWNQYFQRYNAALGLPKLKEIDPVSSKRKSSIMDPARSLALSIRDRFEEPIMKLYLRYDWPKRLMRQAQTMLRTTPTLSELSLYSREAIYAISKAQDRLGYKPQFDLNTGLQLTVRWLNHEKPSMHG